jgi:hypothetical protein
MSKVVLEVAVESFVWLAAGLYLGHLWREKIHALSRRN